MQEATQVLQKQLQELEKKEAQMLDRLVETENSSLVRLGHTDVKSSLRYQAGDIEVVRAAGKRLPHLC